MTVGISRTQEYSEAEVATLAISMSCRFPQISIRHCLLNHYLRKLLQRRIQFLSLDEAVASRAAFVIVSGSDGRSGLAGGRTGGNAFGAS